MLPIIPVHYYVHLEKDDLDNKTKLELNLFQNLAAACQQVPRYQAHVPKLSPELD